MPARILSIPFHWPALLRNHVAEHGRQSGNTHERVQHVQCKQDDDRKTTLWLSVTALLGATFVGGQVYEFTSFYREGLGFTSSLFGSTGSARRSRSRSMARFRVIASSQVSTLPLRWS